MNQEPHNSDETDLPPHLTAELKRLYRPRLSVPANVDETILSQARARLAGRRRIGLLVALAAPAAAAACIALILWAAWPKPKDRAFLNVMTSIPAASNREDVDRDGRVNILDALALARQLDAGTAVGADFNRDGRTDRDDVDALARSVVRLDRGVLQ